MIPYYFFIYSSRHSLTLSAKAATLLSALQTEGDNLRESGFAAGKDWRSNYTQQTSYNRRGDYQSPANLPQTQTFSRDYWISPTENTQKNTKGT